MSDFRSNVSGFLKQVHTTKRPIVITQHGKSSAILLDVSEYERIVEKLELIQDIETATKQIDENKGIPHKQAYKRLKERISK
jgi:prevent-host-death family protein